MAMAARLLQEQTSGDFGSGSFEASPPPSPSPNMTITYSVLGILAGGAAAYLCVLCCMVYVHRRRQQRANRRIAYATPNGIVWGTGLDKRRVNFRQVEDEWVEYARTLVLSASNTTTQQVVAVAAFRGETEVDLSVQQGEQLWLLVGAEAPAGWLIVERETGQGPRRGLVPATYVTALTSENLRQVEALQQQHPPQREPPGPDDEQEKASTQAATHAATQATLETRGLLPSQKWDLD